MRWMIESIRSANYIGIYIFVTVNNESIILHSAGSPPSKPRPSHPPPWASDGEEPSLHFSIKSDGSLITEIEVLFLISGYRFN